MNDVSLRYPDFKGRLSFVKDSLTVMYQNFPNHNDQSFFEKSCVSLKKEIDSTIECSQNGHETTIYGVEIDIQEDKFVSELFELTPDIELYSLIIEGRKIEGQTL